MKWIFSTTADIELKLAFQIFETMKHADGNSISFSDIYCLGGDTKCQS
jgi:hypothetical protein